MRWDGKSYQGRQSSSGTSWCSGALFEEAVTKGILLKKESSLFGTLGQCPIFKPVQRVTRDLATLGVS